MDELQPIDNPGKSYYEIESSEKTSALLAHILTLVGGFIAPLVIYLVENGNNPKRLFALAHAKEALNFQISMFIYIVGLLILTVFTFIIFIGFIFYFLIILVAIYGFVISIIAAVKASGGEMFRYPLCIRFIK